MHAGDELHPLTLLPFQFDETVAFIDLTMSVVDVHRQPERTDHLTVVDEDFADAFDPMDGPVRPDASMVESERRRIPHRVGDGRSHPVAVAFVDQLDPTVEGADEPAVTQSEQRAQVAVPHDLTGMQVPRPLADSTPRERGAQPICSPNFRHRRRDLTLLGRSCGSEPQTQTGGEHRCQDSHPMTSAAGDVVHPAERDGRDRRRRSRRWRSAERFRRSPSRAARRPATESESRRRSSNPQRRSPSRPRVRRERARSIVRARRQCPPPRQLRPGDDVTQATTRRTSIASTPSAIWRAVRRSGSHSVRYPIAM